MSMCNTFLRLFGEKEYVDFDPSNPKHRAAFIQLLVYGKQDEKLRFYTRRPFESVLTQMQMQMSLHACKSELKSLSLSEDDIFSHLAADAINPENVVPFKKSDAASWCKLMI
jgi:hypothetical protein